jgi:hypothetical protein
VSIYPIKNRFHGVNSTTSSEIIDASLALTGCNAHPSPDDQRIIAKVLGDTIKKRPGWDTAKVGQKKIDRKNRIVISLATLPAGVYFIGNLITGWKRFAITR